MNANIKLISLCSKPNHGGTKDTEGQGGTLYFDFEFYGGYLFDNYQ